MDRLSIMGSIFPGSSAVERLAVNEKVVGSIPTRGAKKLFQRTNVQFPFHLRGF